MPKWIRALLCIGVCASGYLIGPAHASEAELHVIADFESPGELYQWEKLRFPVQQPRQVFDLALTDERASLGSGALKVTQPLEQAQRVAWGTVSIPADWSEWETLKWDVYWDAPVETAGRLTVTVDITDRNSTALWTDRFHRGFQIRPGWKTLSVTVDELQPRIDVRRVEQLAFGLNCSTPTTIYLDNVRLEGKRKEPLPQAEPMFRRQLSHRTFVWLIGDDFRRWQCIADGYYEPKGWEPSNDLVSSMKGLRFVEESELPDGHEESTVWLTLAKDVPRTAPEAKTDQLPREAGTLDFRVRVSKDTKNLVGYYPLIVAGKNDANLVHLAFQNDDLFFEIRKDGQRHIARPWWMGVWGDIHKRPVHWRAGSEHQIRVTWGPKGMFLYLDDEEVPYWPLSLTRKKDIELPPSPYAGSIPEGLGELHVGNSPGGGAPGLAVIDELRVRNVQVLGPEWEDLLFVRSGEMVSRAFDRGPRFKESSFALRWFGYDAEIPPGTSIEFSFRGTNEIARQPIWFTEWSEPVVATATQPAVISKEVLTELNQYRWLLVKVVLNTDGPKVTPRLRRHYFLQHSGKNPCLFLSEERLETLRQRCQGANKALFQRLKALADKGQVGAQGNAFLYQITGDETYAQQAKAKLDEILEKRKYAEEREAIAIDWILPACTPEERRRYVKMLTVGLWDYGMLAQNVWWNQMYNRWRHAYTHTFLKNLVLVQQVAHLSNDEPLTEETLGFDLFRLKHSFDSTERFFRLFVIPAINRTGGVWPEGFGYHSYTGPGPALSVAAWESATGESLWEEAWAFANVPSWYFYSRRPHAGRTVAVNDDRSGMTALMSPWLPMLASVYRDPIAQRDAKAIADWLTENARQERPRVPDFGYYYMTDFLLWYDPSIPAARLEDLPLDRFFAEAGWVLMRSGWEKDDTLALFMPGDWFGGHKQADTGSFLICKLGDLALDPPDTRRNASNQHFAYRVKSIAHNVVAIDDPDEPAGDGGLVRQSLGDGGQHRPGMPQLGDVRPGTVFDSADVLAYESTREFNYTAADLTGAYGKWRYGHPHIIKRYYRQFLYLRPDTFVVFDRVTLTDPKYDCKWLLHALNKPAVDGEGKQMTDLVTRYVGAPQALLEQGEGALRMVPVLPESAVLTLREVQGKHQDDKIVPEATIWQLELEQDKKTGERSFLVVLVAGKKEAPPTPKVKLIREENRVGVEITVGEERFRVLFNETGEMGGSVTLGGPGVAGQKVELARNIVQ